MLFNSILKPTLATLLALTVAFMLAFTACSDDDPVSPSEPDPDPEPQANLAEVMASDDDFSTLVSIVPQGLLDALETSELTVFAPTNDAFDEIPSEVLESLTPEDIELIITYHLVEGTTLAADVPEQTDIESVQGELLLLQSNNGVFVNGSAEVVKADLTAENGVIHGIDQVLLPSEIRKALGATNIVDVAEEAGGFETLLAALESTELKTTLQFLEPFTVFAPNDAAFAELPEGTLENLSAEELTQILTYHVLDSQVMAGDLQPQQDPATLQGESLYIEAENGAVTINNSATVTSADIEATNGVIHVVDAVLLPDAFGTVVDNAIKRFDFTTLVDTVVDAELAEALQGDGPFTVFAPTNDAFADLPDGLLESLTPDQIQEILLYHVVEGNIASGDLDGAQAAASMSGENLYITADNGVTVNGSSSVVAADIGSSNGIIHAIDEVLIPNEFLNIVQIAQKNFDLTTLVELVVEADLAETLSGNGPFTVFAPINSAFEDIADDLEGLTQEDISDILKYHVIADRIESGDIPAGTTNIETVNGEEVTILNDNGSVTVDGANVITVDLSGENGVIHLIDAVILP